MVDVLGWMDDVEVSVAAMKDLRRDSEAGEMLCTRTQRIKGLRARMAMVRKMGHKKKPKWWEESVKYQDLGPGKLELNGCGPVYGAHEGLLREVEWEGEVGKGLWLGEGPTRGGWCRECRRRNHKGRQRRGMVGDGGLICSGAVAGSWSARC